MVKVGADNCLFDRLTITNGFANGTGNLKFGAGVFKSFPIRKMAFNNCKFTKNISIDTGSAINSIFNTNNMMM